MEILEYDPEIKIKTTTPLTKTHICSQSFGSHFDDQITQCFRPKLLSSEGQWWWNDSLVAIVFKHLKCFRSSNDSNCCFNTFFFSPNSLTFAADWILDFSIYCQLASGRSDVWGVRTPTANQNICSSQTDSSPFGWLHLWKYPPSPNMTPDRHKFQVTFRVKLKRKWARAHVNQRTRSDCQFRETRLFLKHISATRKCYSPAHKALRQDPTLRF